MSARASAPAQDLTLCGSGLQRYRRILKAYAAALYQADCGAAPSQNLARRLELSYFWSIDGERFGDAALRHLEATVDAATLEALRPRLNRLARAYRSVEPGDRYALTYLPGRGTELSLNGRVLDSVPGEEFARVYFGLWIGDAPLDAGLRDDLLKR